MSKEINKKEDLEKVTGGGMFFDITSIVHHDFNGQSVSFVSNTNKTYQATVKTNGVVREMFVDRIVYFDVYELNFGTRYNRYYGGWYKFGDAMDHFVESNKVDESEVFAKVRVF